MGYRIERHLRLAAAGSGNGSSEPERVDYLENLRIEIDGTFVATATVEARASSASTYKAIGALTAPGGLSIPEGLNFWQIRVTVSGWASGTLSAVMVGRVARR